MRQAVLEYLACPACHEHLELVRPDGDDIAAGELRCPSCDTRYAIRGGIPRLLGPALPAPLRKTAEAFGWQWQHFTELHPEYEEQFLDWVAPLEREFFAGKRVLDAGCGIGRHAYLVARFGAEKVVAMDLSDAVETAYGNLNQFPNVHVVQGDLLRPPFRNGDGDFDIVYCIGVLHHLPDPRAGFLSLARLVRPGGTLAVWVYGYEGNRFVRWFIEPLRRITTRISPSLLRIVAWPLALLLHGLVRLVYGPTRSWRAFRFLPVREYLVSLNQFSFRQNYSIVFDQLVAPSSRYIRGPELEEWFRAAGLTEVAITSRNGNSWRGRGRRPDQQLT